MTVAFAQVAGGRMAVIQAPKLETRTMRYELADYEWTAIKPMLPNCGVPRVNDRRVLNGIKLREAIVASKAKLAPRQIRQSGV
jgi:hypothetical protein